MNEYVKSEYVENRKEEFIKGLLDLMMQMPYDKIAVRDLCEHLQISRKTFYRYFSGKEEALNALLDFMLLSIGAYQAPVEISTGRPYLDEMTRYFYYWSENRQILQMLLSNGLLEKISLRLKMIAMSEMDIFRKKLGHLDPLIQESIVAYYMGGLMAMLLHWAHHNYAEPPERVAERLVHLAQAGAVF